MGHSRTARFFSFLMAKMKEQANKLIAKTSSPTDERLVSTAALNSVTEGCHT